MDDHSEPKWWRTPRGWILCGFLLVAGFFLLTQHTAHAFGVLPYLFILACPLLHMFHHHGHRGHTKTGAGAPPNGENATPQLGDRP